MTLTILQLIRLSSALALMAISQLSHATLIHSSGDQSGVQNLWGQYLTPLGSRNSFPRLQPKAPSNPLLALGEPILNPPTFCQSSSPSSCFFNRPPKFLEPIKCNSIALTGACGSLIPIIYEPITRPSANVPEPNTLGLMLLGVLLTSANCLYRVIKK